VVRIVVVTGVALGMSFTAVELLWQPRLTDLLADNGSHGVVFGALAAASMLAVALGACASERLNRRLPAARLSARPWIRRRLDRCARSRPLPASFALFYLLAYLGMGLSGPMHYELLNDAVGSTARATLISGEALASQGGALVANLGVGALAAVHGAGTAWALAGALPAACTLAVALPLLSSVRKVSA
jgi:hypothetical protein